MQALSKSCSGESKPFALPATVAISGQSKTLAYPMKGCRPAAQLLILQPGGSVLSDHITVKKCDFTVAAIDERIAKD